MEYTDTKNTTSGVAWAALIIAVVAVIFAWAAFNRAGRDIGDIVQQQVEESTQKAQEEYKEAELKTRANVSTELQKAANDAAVDKDPNNVGE